ncbi:PilZ domain-containing protein [Candidatus Omnitrophota bacterium]
MSENKRKFVRFNVEDILEIRALTEVAKKFRSVSRDFSLIGMCFFSDFKWDVGQVLIIEYFLPEDLEAVKIKTNVVWSEFIDDKKGFLVGVEILDIDAKNADKFTQYYFRKVRERFFG